jgi:hypothetical protein
MVDLVEHLASQVNCNGMQLVAAQEMLQMWPELFMETLWVEVEVRLEATVVRVQVVTELLGVLIQVRVVVVQVQEQAQVA